VTVAEQLVVLAAGFGAGILTATVGVATLLSFPVLLALGLPPVTANVSNTVGLTPAGISGSFGYRAELSEHPAVSRRVVITCSLGSVVGAALLLGLPSTVFEKVAPWLILGTCLLVGAQPRISAWVRRRRTGPEPAPRHTLSPVTTGMATLVGVYGGYFGAGSGVMMLAVLGFGTDLDLRVLNATKTLAVLAGNGVAAVIYVFVADLDWRVVALLAAGSLVGGYVGAHVGRRLPTGLLRSLIVVAGVVGAISLLT
jgi:uncharacterized membrane protein YfcA